MVNGSIRPQYTATTVWGWGKSPNQVSRDAEMMPRVPPGWNRRQEKNPCPRRHAFSRVCLLILRRPALLYGQGGAYGTILGTVNDNSGAVVAKAGVDVTNIATNVTKHTETTSSGDFTVPYLHPGPTA